MAMRESVRLVVVERIEFVVRSKSKSVVGSLRDHHEPDRSREAGQKSVAIRSEDRFSRSRSKFFSPDLVHKTEVGSVILNV